MLFDGFVGFFGSSVIFDETVIFASTCGKARLLTKARVRGQCETILTETCEGTVPCKHLPNVY